MSFHWNPPAGEGIAGPQRLAARRRNAALLALVLLAALLLRLNNIGFGLPSLYDPDEPLFMVKAAGLLKNHTLNPHWFGHPATTTIYLTALIQAGVFLSGLIAGHFTTISDFVHAAYADPGIVWLPVRVAMAILGTIAVGLTYLLGEKMFGRSVGLLAASLLALNSLHISWSQVVRSDVQASDFMLGALLVACRLAKTGRSSDAIWAGLLTGFAVATKWPAVTVLAGVAGAVLSSMKGRDTGLAHAAKQLALSGFAALAGLFIASPFIFIDYPTVLANLAGEARPFHVGHTGNGFFSNLFTYLDGFTVDSMGWLGLALAIIGVIVVGARSRGARYILLPATVAFFISISAPRLVWSRWLIPGLPYLTILAAAAVVWIAHVLSRGRSKARGMVTAGLACVALLPSASGAIGQSRERRKDTRAEAAQWIVDRAPHGSTIVLEHLELKLRNEPYRFLFPMGSRGCQDARTLLTSGVRYDDLQRARGSSPVVDLGNVDPEMIGTCTADFAVLSYYDEYRKDTKHFPKEIATYGKILEGGQTVAMFTPAPGWIGGPIVRIVAIPNHAEANNH